MHTFSTLPAAEGFRMPAEYEPHRGCVMIWPVRPGSWLYGGRDAQPAFAQAARAIAESETVWMLAGPADAGAVQAEFAGDENIHVLTIETDDAWARDVGPTCVVDDHGTVRGVDWQFNAWGGMVDGLYAHWEKDNAAARAICAALGMDCYDALGRRGHHPCHRSLSAEPWPQPGAEPGRDRAGAEKLSRRTEDRLAAPGHLQR